MKIFCKAKKDTYITNKIIDSAFRAIDANVGQAGTLDLFKIYNENKINGNDGQIEISRLLLYFDLQKIHQLTGSKLNINDPSFKAEIKLFDVRSGHAVPKNFNIIAMPLSKSFDEGIGKDVAMFGDIDVANFLTASYSNGIPNAWNGAGGASVLGTLNSINIDAITDGDLGNGPMSFISQQFFENGTEDLILDVTSVISGTIAKLVPDCGFRISFGSSEENDQKTRFLKRFASRHSSNPFIHPRLEISFDDSRFDDRGNAYFDCQNRFFLKNIVRGDLKNLQSGSTEISGSNCAKLEISCGDFIQQFDVDQFKSGLLDLPIDGTYFADASVYLNDFFDQPSVGPPVVSGSTFAQQFVGKNEVTFQERWKSNDGNLIYHTGTLQFKFPERNAIYREDLSGYYVNSFNLRKEYDNDSFETVRLFVFNHNKQIFKTRNTTLKAKSEILESLHYRIKDVESGFLVFDFDIEKKSTKTSYDADGHYFDFDFGMLPNGRTYKFEFLININGQRKIIEDEVSFRID